MLGRNRGDGLRARGKSVPRLAVTVVVVVVVVVAGVEIGVPIDMDSFCAVPPTDELALRTGVLVGTRVEGVAVIVEADRAEGELRRKGRGVRTSERRDMYEVR